MYFNKINKRYYKNKNLSVINQFNNRFCFIKI